MAAANSRLAQPACLLAGSSFSSKNVLKIVELSNNLPLITKQQNELAFSKCFDNYGVHSRKSIFR
jgi:hypothetical protein